MEELVIALKELKYLTKSDKKELLNLGSFNKRLFYQKLIFLLSLKTKALDYHFNWYLRGPYSPGLTRDLFAIEELLHERRPYINNLINRNAGNQVVDDGVEGIRALESSFHQEFHQDWEAEDLEVLASLAFIERYTYEKCKGSKHETINEFRDRKPELADQKSIERYWKVLQSSNFV